MEGNAFIQPKIPIRTIKFSGPAEKASHDKMAALVERMLVLHKQSPRTPSLAEPAFAEHLSRGTPASAASAS